MDKDSWDRLPFIDRYELVRGLCDIPKTIDSSSNYFTFYVERWIAHQDLRREYVNELARITDCTPTSDHLWLLVTATPSERCLAAYNCLEGSTCS